MNNEWSNTEGIFAQPYLMDEAELLQIFGPVPFKADGSQEMRKSGNPVNFLASKA